MPPGTGAVVFRWAHHVLAELARPVPARPLHLDPGVDTAGRGVLAPRLGPVVDGRGDRERGDTAVGGADHSKGVPLRLPPPFDQPGGLLPDESSGDRDDLVVVLAVGLVDRVL